VGDLDGVVKLAGAFDADAVRNALSVSHGSQKVNFE
jgi:hypothetical protein